MLQFQSDATFNSIPFTINPFGAAIGAEHAPISQNAADDVTGASDGDSATTDHESCH